MGAVVFPRRLLSSNRVRLAMEMPPVHLGPQSGPTEPKWDGGSRGEIQTKKKAPAKYVVSKARCLWIGRVPIGGTRAAKERSMIETSYIESRPAQREALPSLDQRTALRRDDNHLSRMTEVNPISARKSKTTLSMITKHCLLAAGLILSGLSASAADSLPVITQSPTTYVGPSGSSATLAVVAAGNALQYSWTFNGDVIPEATGPLLILTNVTTATSGAYQALVFNSAGLVKSAIADVQVAATALPFTDNFASRGVIGTAWGLGYGISLGATKESGDPKPCNARVGRSVWLSWVAPTNGIAMIATMGSSFDTVLGVYTGTNLTTLVKVATDDDAGEYHTSYVEFNAQAGKAYQIYVGSLDKDGGPMLLGWSLLATAFQLPTIVSPATNVTTLPGGAASFGVTFQSATPVTVQWYHNGLAIPGATNQTSTAPGLRTSLSWSQLTVADLGSYQVALTSSYWTKFLDPVEIQFNSQGIATAGARHKLSQILAP